MTGIYLPIYATGQSNIANIFAQPIGFDMRRLYLQYMQYILRQKVKMYSE